MVEKELLDKVIEAGLYAANEHGKQASVIIAVTDKELRHELSEENRKIEGWKEGIDPFYGARCLAMGDAMLKRAGSMATTSARISVSLRR